MGIFFFFESREANLALYFAVFTVVLTLGPEYYFPSLSPTRYFTRLNSINDDSGIPAYKK